MKDRTCEGLLMSSWTGSTCTPEPTSAVIDAATCLRVSMRRAVKMSLRFAGDARANSCAQLRPMPELAPVMRMVLPSRRFAIAVDILRRVEGVPRSNMGRRRFSIGWCGEEVLGLRGNDPRE